MGARVIYANLDAEATFAAATLPQRVRRVLSRLSTALIAFARDGDELRTLLPVAAERLAHVPGLPRVRLASGALAQAAGPASLLAWAVTPEVAAFPSSGATAGDLDLPLHDLVWRLPRPGPDAVARVNHRSFALELALATGRALPGARMVSSLAALESHLRTARAGAWVVKAPYSAAGRWRYVHRGGKAQRRPLERLFWRHGALVFEPWMDRLEDFGLAAVVTPLETKIVGFHRLIVDRRGRFRGLELPAAGDGAAGLSQEDETRFEETAGAVAVALRAAGYVGPFGIDGYRYRAAGGVVFHPLSEINARITFGLVARALVDRIAGALGLAGGERVRLVFGGRTSDSLAPGRSRLPILYPDEGGSAVEVEIPSRIV